MKNDWKNLTDRQKCEKILLTQMGIVPCDENCNNCPIWRYKTCGDNVSYNRALKWLRNNKNE